MYKAEILESEVELTKKERIMYKQFDECQSLDKVVSVDEGLTLNIVNIIKVRIHNDSIKASDKEYEKIVYVTDAGERYVSGSKSLYESIEDIWEEMEEEMITVKVIKKASSNYPDRCFMTAVLI